MYHGSVMAVHAAITGNRLIFPIRKSVFITFPAWQQGGDEQ